MNARPTFIAAVLVVAALFAFVSMIALVDLGVPALVAALTVVTTAIALGRGPN